MDSQPPQAAAPPAAAPALQPAPWPAAPARTYSLAELFILVTACAVVAGVGAPIFRQLSAAERWSELLGSSFVGALVGAVLGMVLGCHRYSKLSGFFECGGMGLLLGGMAGPLYCLPPAELATSAATMLVGSCFLIAVACLAARFRPSDKPPGAALETGQA